MSRRLIDVQLGEDRPHVRLDSALGHDEPLGDCRVRLTFGDQGENLAFPWPSTSPMVQHPVLEKVAESRSTQPRKAVPELDVLRQQQRGQAGLLVV